MEQITGGINPGSVEDAAEKREGLTNDFGEIASAAATQ